ncbi:VOC family protein [Asaia astilbis]|uniref:VOC family protein n=1 Tax=Asaia astilbis TaxID=610244 RepID=UPI003570C95E
MFHLSLPVENFSACKEFYVRLFGAELIDLSETCSNIFVFGGYVTLHDRAGSLLTDEVRKSMHFGEEVTLQAWKERKEILDKNVVSYVFLQEPDTIKGVRGKMVVKDPSGNLVEINSRL